MKVSLDKVVDGVMYGSVIAGGVVVGELNNVPVGTLTPSVLLGIGILLMFTGKIVHASALDREREVTNKFETAYKNEAEARTNSDRQVSELLEYAKETNEFIKSIALSKKQGGE